MLEQVKARAALYRHEAADLQAAAELIRDPHLREQLLAIAREYEAAATELELLGQDKDP